ncbi:MAG: hypothetical protein GF364_21415 [Candidatus Lokiarchaeota archaeon]|nr:hypothetical protein [Candidatus Lokiarchaeota archaeon]
MLLENPDYLDLPENYLLTYDLYLWIACIIIGVISSILFFIRTKKSRIDIQKGLLLGLAIFCLLFSLMRVAYILSIHMPGDGSGEVYDFWTLMGYICGLSGFGGVLFGIERYVVKKTKYSLSIFTFAVVIFGIIALTGNINRELVMSFVYAIVLVDAALMAIIYIGLIQKTTGVIRKRTAAALIGVVALVVSTALDSQVGLAILGNLYVPPLLAIMGILLITIVQRYQ